MTEEIPGTLPGGFTKLPIIGVVALQGGFQAHLDKVTFLGCEGREVRNLEDLTGLAGLILPGGESTVLKKLGLEKGLWSVLVEKVEAGLPIFGTCAGAILLSTEVVDHDDFGIGLIPVKIQRNAYGSQKDSFITGGPGVRERVFIRAPRIVEASDRVSVIDHLEETQEPLAVRFKDRFLATYHPELCEDSFLLESFLKVVLAKRFDLKERA